MANYEPTESTQKTPEGYEIPVPNKDDVLRDLTKVAKPRKSRLRLRRSKKER